MENSKTYFIPPGTNITQEHIDINHFATMSPDLIVERWKSDIGKEIASRIIDVNFNKIEIEKIVGKFYGQLDLRGFNFSNKNISHLNLTNCDFFRADFYKADCSYSDFSNSWLSEANLKSANFQWCKMTKVILDNVNYNEKTNFNGVDLSSINFTMSTLFQDLALSQQRISDLKRQNPFLAKVLSVTTDYGRSLSRWLLWCIGMIVLFAIIYSKFDLTISTQAIHPNIWNNLYFSIVTFTTVGYGDITPIDGIGKTIAMFEIGMGYLMGGLLIAILTKKVLV